MTQGYPGAVLVTGHMVDAPGRAAARFPPERVSWVTAQVRKSLAEWDMGPATTLVCGGARGTDIIAAEQALARKAHVIVCLALPVAEFEEQSVALPDSDWLDRFRSLLVRAEVHLPEVGSADGDAAFVRANDRMVELARALDPQPYLLAVWDGKGGDGPGGTADLVLRLGYRPDDPRVRLVDPTSDS